MNKVVELAAKLHRSRVGGRHAIKPAATRSTADTQRHALRARLTTSHVLPLLLPLLSICLGTCCSGAIFGLSSTTPNSPTCLPAAPGGRRHNGARSITPLAPPTLRNAPEAEDPPGSQLSSDAVAAGWIAPVLVWCSQQGPQGIPPGSDQSAGHTWCGSCNGLTKKLNHNKIQQHPEPSNLPWAASAWLDKPSACGVGQMLFLSPIPLYSRHSAW